VKGTYVKLSNWGYDSLKFVALVLLPGLAAAYFSLAQIWDLPNAEQVVGTATVLDTLLGLLLKSSSSRYVEPRKVIDGALVVTSDEDAQYMGIAWDEQFPGIDTSKTQTVTLVIAENKPAKAEGTN
jgi:hypothetical protein